MRDLQRRGFVVLSVVTVGVTLLVGLALWRSVEVDSLAAVSKRLAKLEPAMMGIRLSLIVVLAAFWPQIIERVQRRGIRGEAVRGRWLGLRWRVIGWLFVIEIVLVQNLVGQMFTAMGGSA